MQELDEDTVLRARIVLDTSGAVEAGDLDIPIKSGALKKESICGMY